MAHLKLMVFGPPRLERDGKTLELNLRRALALLVYLAVTGKPQSRDALATVLWPESDQREARGRLRRTLHRLTETLSEGILDVGPDTICLYSAADLWLDSAAFRQHVTAGLPAAPADALAPARLAHLTAAVELYADDFLAGFTLPDSPTFDEWQFFVRETLRQLYGQALEQLVVAYRSQSAWDQAITYARKWAALDGLHEPAHRALMRLYAWAGQHAAALRQYQECVRILDAELGAAPEDETTALYEAIRARQLTPPSAAEHSSTPGRAVVELEPHARFVLEELLAEGGQGEVYRGRDQLTGQPVAIKRLRADLVARHPEAVARFVREGAALRRLNHPNIVGILDTFEHAGHYAIVMAYVPGGSLRALLEQTGRLPFERVLAIGLELADALSRAHHLGIVHRDLKPENVLLAADGTPRLTDFGMAQLEQDDTALTQSGTLFGSPAYMSPEAVRGEELDARSDIWSLGVVLYELLAGRRPFEGAQITPVLASILEEPVPDLWQFRQDASPALVDLLRRMLLKDRAQRLASMRQVAAELEAIRTGRTAEGQGSQHRLSHAREAGEPGVPAVQPGIAFVGRHNEQPIRAHNLPAQSTPFIGRDQELAEVRQLLDEPICRLVTLVGPGGMGKTRLALAAAEALVRTGSPFADGVFFVSLAPLIAVADIVPTIANALGFSFYTDPSPLEQLLDFLRPKRMLLVLDNFEHLLGDESATLVNTILTAAPQVKLLVTSRVRLNVQGEHGFVVAGMEVPELPPGRRDIAEGYSAMQLFQQSARRARPDFVLTPDNLTAVARICRLVHGMPLGIELAAAWMEMLSPAEIAAEIEQSLDFLETEWRDIPERQHSLRAVFDASWKLLDAHERSTLETLTVFQGSFAREAAQYVAGASLKMLRALVNQSWLQPEGGRFKIHDLLRQYAAEKLQADPSAWRRSRERHSAYFVDLLGQLDGPMKGAQPRSAFDALTADLDDIRAVWHWLLEQGQLDRVIQQMLPVLFRYCHVQFKAFVLLSLLETAQQAVSASDDQNDRFQLAILLTARGAFLRNGAPLRAHWSGQFHDDAIKQAWSMAGTSESLRMMGFWGVLLAAIYGLTSNTVEGVQQLRGLLPDLRQAGQPSTLAFALQSLGHLLFLQLPDETPDQPLAEAAQHLTEALAIFGALGDEQESGNTLRLRAITHLLQQRLAEARDDLQVAQAKFERVGDWATATGTNWHLADVHFRLGEIEAAFRYLRQMSQTFAQRGHPIAAAVALSRESYEALRYSSIDHARQTREQCLALVRETGAVFEEAWYLWEMGEIERVAGDYAAARQWYEQARELFEKAEVKREIAFYHRGLGDIAQALGDYAEARRHFQESLTVARQSAHDWAVTYALAGLARAALALGEHEATQGYLLEALQKAMKIADSGIMMVVLAGVAGLYAAIGDRERAVELGTLVVDHYAAWRETKAQAAAVIQAAAAVLPPDCLARSQKRGRNRDIWETAAQLVRDLSPSG